MIQLTTPLIVALGTFALLFIIQVLYLIVVYGKPYRFWAKHQAQNEIQEGEAPGITVIITSHNESEYLQENLETVLQQDYPNFEVIVVNCGSTDETDMVIKRFQQTYSNLYQTFIPANAEDVNLKKLAITIGIKAAKNDILLFTEPYCHPKSARWISSYAHKFAEGNSIVLGYCKIAIPNRLFMRQFILFDNMLHSLKYLSFAIMGKPFMGIGRNMAYRKELFYANKGFSDILNIDGGEDDLFINRIATKQHTSVLLSADSMTETTIVDKLSVWKRLKAKYMQTKKYYHGSANFFLGIETWSKYLFYLASIILLVWTILTSQYIIAGALVTLFILRYIIALVQLNRASNLLGSCKLHINLLFLELFQPINNLRLKKYAHKSTIKNSHY